MKNLLPLIAALCLYASTYGHVQAQDLIQKSSNAAPVEITADNTLEWDRNAKTFTARGNAKAQQGDTAVEADLLTARYRSSSEKSIDVREVEATGGVVLTSRDSKAFGNRALYSLDTGLAVMTGGDLRLVAPNGMVKAKERFEYWTNENRLEAVGRAEIQHKNEKGQVNTLTADRFTALLAENAKGQQGLKSLEAEGNVIITTPDETVRGAYGFYDAQAQTVDITGGVTITRGPNILEGENAAVDLKTGLSKITGSGTSGGQVRGVFYPDTSPDKKAAP